MKKLSWYIEAEKVAQIKGEQEKREMRDEQTEELRLRVEDFKRLLDVDRLQLSDEGVHATRDPQGRDGVAWVLSFQTDSGGVAIIFNSWNDGVKMGKRNTGDGMRTYGKHDTPELLRDIARLVLRDIREG